MLSSFELSFYYYYSLIHIPITIFMDSSVVLPLRLFPKAVRSTINWHITQNNDYLLSDKPFWLVTFVIVELLFQLPLFVYFVVQLPKVNHQESIIADDDKFLKKTLQEQNSNVISWLRWYGLNASFTTLICIVHIWKYGHVVDSSEALSLLQKLNLMSIYLPTFLIPLRLCFI